ncbi:hypothetical protein EBR43_05665, partial [bacterium]|nr:hypothetical protein [bacterium]
PPLPVATTAIVKISGITEQNTDYYTNYNLHNGSFNPCIYSPGGGVEGYVTMAIPYASLSNPEFPACTSVTIVSPYASYNNTGSYQDIYGGITFELSNFTGKTWTLTITRNYKGYAQYTFTAAGAQNEIPSALYDGLGNAVYLSDGGTSTSSFCCG